MRISDWSSDVCSSDLNVHRPLHGVAELHVEELRGRLLADARRVRQRALHQLAPFVSGTLGAGLLAVNAPQRVNEAGDRRDALQRIEVRYDAFRAGKNVQGGDLPPQENGRTT